MILKASQRSGGKQLGLHLLKTEENEHVEIHEVRGFISETVLGAMQEAHALSRGTRCRQYLFSVSLSPPETENVRLETFEKALDAIEERLGLTGQPRIIVFHEKEGRRHAHAVWSRINADTMTAKPMSFFKSKLQDVSRQLFLDNGWKMPKGLIQRGAGDPRNFTLDEWQRSKRLGNDPKITKELVQECWASSDNRISFESALEERGLYLARGDRRGRVIVSFDGEIHSLTRALGRKERELWSKLGRADALKSVEETKEHIAASVGPRLSELIRIAKRNSSEALKPLLAEKSRMTLRHVEERQKVDLGQAARWASEVRARALRLRVGLAGLWDRLTGDRAKTIARNEFEVHHSLRRDRQQRDQLICDQLSERQQLQNQIKIKRREGAAVVLALFADAKAMRDRSRLSRGNAEASFTRRAQPVRGTNSRRENGLDLSPS